MDDTNSWDCSVCTYRNGAEAFKCLMCDVRKGTSTRKPRINLEMVAKQVARQQEQIKQQVLKSAVKPKSSGEKSFRGRIDDTNSNSSMASTTSSGPSSPTVTNSSCSNDLDCSNNTANSPSFFGYYHFCVLFQQFNLSFNFLFIDNLNTLNKTNSPASKSLSTPSSSRNSFKMNNFENNVCENGIDSTISLPVNGNKPARKVKTIGPRVKLKNVDRNDVFVKSVTVNNVTVVITEFKPKRKHTDLTENKVSKISADSTTPAKGLKESTATKNGKDNRTKVGADSANKKCTKNGKGKDEDNNSNNKNGPKKRQLSTDSENHVTSTSKKFLSNTD